jgi:DNA-binding response OmpR family regulator
MEAGKGRLFLIDWDVVAVEEHSKHLYEDGWEVERESVDPRKAFDLIKSYRPNVVVIYLSSLPAYGRALADDLRSSEETKDIPLLFVDGKEKAVKKALAETPGAIATTQEDILGELLRFRVR